MPATTCTEALLDAVVKKRKLNGGTGIYFEDTEVKQEDALLHPLQRPYHAESVIFSKLGSFPVGQPLYAPPVLPSTLQGQDDENEDDFRQPAGLPAPRALQHDPRIKHSTEHPVLSEEKKEDSLFCEQRRSALRQRLHSRDYRLSTDELTFVEAAVQLSKVVLPSPPPPPVPKKKVNTSQPGRTALTKPQLPLVATAASNRSGKRLRTVSVN